MWNLCDRLGRGGRDGRVFVGDGALVHRLALRLARFLGAQTQAFAVGEPSTFEGHALARRRLRPLPQRARLVGRDLRVRDLVHLRLEVGQVGERFRLGRCRRSRDISCTIILRIYSSSRLGQVGKRLGHHLRVGGVQRLPGSAISSAGDLSGHVRVGGVGEAAELHAVAYRRERVGGDAGRG